MILKQYKRKVFKIGKEEKNKEEENLELEETISKKEVIEKIKEKSIVIKEFTESTILKITDKLDIMIHGDEEEQKERERERKKRNSQLTPDSYLNNGFKESYLDKETNKKPKKDRRKEKDKGIENRDLILKKHKEIEERTQKFK